MKDIPAMDIAEIRAAIEKVKGGKTAHLPIVDIDDYLAFKEAMNAKGIVVVEKILRDEKEKEGEIKRIVVS